jgi:DNA-binding Lrp family transcriptional regulator
MDNRARCGNTPASDLRPGEPKCAASSSISAASPASALREIHSELYSTSGPFDLLLKLYIPEGEDIGKFINDNLLDIAGIERTETTLTFKAF